VARLLPPRARLVRLWQLRIRCYLSSGSNFLVSSICLFRIWDEWLFWVPNDKYTFDVCTPSYHCVLQNFESSAFPSQFFSTSLLRETPERAFTSTMPPDDAPPMDDAALLAALNQPHVDLSELVVTDVKVHDEEALIRRVNLLEILTEEHEDVHPPPEEVVSSW
jgi:hypothetical protein